MHSLISLLTLGAALVSAAPGTSPRGTKIPNNYMIIYKESVPMAKVNAHKNEIAAFHAAGALSRRWNLKGVKDTYQIGKFKGYSGEFDSSTIAKIKQNPDVDYVEQEVVLRLVDDGHRTQADTSAQPNAPWGLNRISHLKAPGSDAKGEYNYDASKAGEGVDVYVIDTGCRTSHTEFEGRAKWGGNTVDKDNTDGNGHGTHCSGTIGGKTYGVAKKVNIVCIKVLSAAGSGSTSGVTAGIQLAADGAAASKRPSVASMSLGGADGADADSKALKAAVANAIKAGVSFAVAAGNDGADAGNTSPANSPGVITVGAIDSKDNMASFTNYGETLEIFAPGVNVLSAWNKDDNAVNTISGTSMATPHVAGMAAYYLSMNVGKTPAQVTEWLQKTAVQCSVKGSLRKSPNLILYNGLDGAGSGPCGGTTPPPDQPGEPDDECPMCKGKTGFSRWWCEIINGC